MENSRKVSWFHSISSIDGSPNSIFVSSAHLVYVKSNTVVGDQKHTTGVVMAEIVMANIPVKNGVVHLIHRPLMVVDTTVAKFLEVSVAFGNFCCLFLLFCFRPLNGDRKKVSSDGIPKFKLRCMNLV